MMLTAEPVAGAAATNEAVKVVANVKIEVNLIINYSKEG
ncbi:hypothetical protein QG37_03919 [Candidozyma auris]|uniref:Uncharacterized protein n=1 Tax=Candidozyma auris TaxID=498019 RepID=A0A0L0NYN4_CANAR|nr:hypothetical protein QG37_03919 [[Candida] auris]